MNGFFSITEMLGIKGKIGTKKKTFPVYNKFCLVAKVRKKKKKKNTLAGVMSAVFTLLSLSMGALVPALCPSVRCSSSYEYKHRAEVHKFSLNLGAVSKF